MTVTIKFLGAAGTVTGSKYLVTGKSAKVLIDVGLFQGTREWRDRNWNDPDVDLKSVNAVLLTHAHIDHTGMLPRYFHLGLHAPIYCTRSTHALCKILLPDSASLQEEEADWRNSSGKSRHHPALPLYTVRDAEAVLENFRTVRYYESIEVAPGVRAKWSPMGHILGAASITLEIDGKRITFSGDIGRYSVPILNDPVPVEFGDLLLIESTYGNRLHSEVNPKERLGEILSKAFKRDGVVVIPSFAVGRAQLLLYYLRELKEEHRIPDVPVIIDSPMAQSATDIYGDNPGDYDKEALDILRNGRDPFSPSKLYFTKSTQESKQLNSIVEPMIIISASGMINGGRILHHLKHRISSPNNTIVFVGYQPPGGRGDYIQHGAETIRLLGDDVVVRADVETVSGLSAHGDKNELLRWCRECTGTPKKVAVVHGEPESASDFAQTLEETFGWNVRIPKYLDEVTV
ncbi:MAG: MBL fold metallo-hydrolase [Bdellovibrionales bacterium]|nr:MBL fold metallo-hydrolase [Bdellovibrionales bacterium]